MKIIKSALIFLLVLIPSMSIAGGFHFRAHGPNSSVSISRHHHYRPHYHYRHYRPHYHYRRYYHRSYSLTYIDHDYYHDNYVVYRQEGRRYIEDSPREILVVPRGSSTYYYCR